MIPKDYRCSACGGSGLDAKGVQGFCEDIVALLAHPWKHGDARHRQYIANLRHIVLGTDLPEDY